MEWTTESCLNWKRGEYGRLWTKWWWCFGAASRVLTCERGSGKWRPDATDCSGCGAVGTVQCAQPAGGDKSRVLLGDELLRRYDDSVRSETAALGASFPLHPKLQATECEGVWGPSRSAKRLDITKTGSLINSFNLDLDIPLPPATSCNQVRTRSTYTNSSFHSPIDLSTATHNHLQNVGHPPPIDSRSARCSASSSCKACHGHGQHPVCPRQGHSPRPVL